MDESSSDATHKTRRKEPKTKKPKAEKKEKRLSRGKKATLVARTERATEADTERLTATPAAPALDRGDEDVGDVERGLSQETILQLRALDGDDDDVYGRGAAAQSNGLGSFFGHVHTGAQSAGIDARTTTCYVENEVSGEFFRVRQRRRDTKRTAFARSSTSFRRLRSHRRRHRRHRLESEESDSDDDRVGASTCSALSWRRVHDVDAALSIMGHGIVVGLCWMDAFNLAATQDRFLQDDATRLRFVCTYSGVADRTRQLFFLLFKYPFLSLSLLGIMRKISRLRLQRPIDHEDPRLQRFRFYSMRLLQGAFACTTTALLVLLVASPSALRLATAFARDPTWCESLVVPSAQLVRLQQCAIANAVFLSLGWLLVCLQCSFGMSSHLSLRRRLVEAHTTMDQLELRTDQLRGKALDGLSIDALKDLIQHHHRAVEATESVLVTKLQMQDPTVGRTTASWGSGVDNVLYGQTPH